MPIMTTAQALVKFLDNQYVLCEGKESKFVDGVFTIFGHGIVCGLGQALDENPGGLRVYQGRNEQGMAHVAMSFAKQNNRRKIIACSSSIGPGAANMVTAAACATVNNIPLLLLPADTFGSRQPDPVLQQFEQPYSLTVTTNDAYRPVCRYFDRIVRPENLMTAMINAMRVLTDVSNTGAVCIALCQDAEGESYDFPESFFAKRVHRISNTAASQDEVASLAEIIRSAKHPMMICGGGVRYSNAGEVLEAFAAKHGIPYGETQAGKSATHSSCPLNMGGLGVTGNSAANTIAKETDVVIGVGTRLSDFTTGSKSLFPAGAKFLTINTSRFDAYKLDALSAVGDAKTTLLALDAELEGYFADWGELPATARAGWDAEMQRLANIRFGEDYTPEISAMYPETLPEFANVLGCVPQTSAIALIRKAIPEDAIIVGASGSLPGDLQRMWTTEEKDSYNMEYGFSCMGYEIAGALGSKLACPDREVFAMAGDGAYLMLHSELVTSLQEGKKINVLLFDNAGFGCINNLEMSNGIGNLATEFRKRDKDGNLLGELMTIDYAACAAGYGVKTYTARTLEELEAALKDAQLQEVSTLIDIKVLPKSMTNGYGAWWNVGLASVSSSDSVRAAYDNKIINQNKARKY